MTTRVHLLLGAVLLALISIPVAVWVSSASARLAGQSGMTAEVATAAPSDEGYCNGDLKRILRRVLTSCGLLRGGSSRGCQPLQARQVAAMSGNDFNALFAPLADRAAIIQFDQDGASLDIGARALLERTFSDQRGASYFLVVSRASPEGSVAYNRELSRQRAESVLEHLRTVFKDPDLDQEVGLPWLGEEFAQLDPDFCTWHRSRAGEQCSTTDLNRSACIAWIDCRL